MKLSRDPNCDACPLHKNAQFVCLLGADIGPTEIAIIGEAPGKREDESGDAFVNPQGAGGKLDEGLQSIDLPRDKCAVFNAVSCRPPGNRTPKVSEIKKCRAWVDHQMEYFKPKYVLLLGNVACQSVLGQKGITKLRGTPHEINGVIYLPTYHPSALTYDPSGHKEQQFFSDFKTFKQLISGDEDEEVKFTVVETWNQVEDMVEDLYGDVSIDIETSCLYPWAEKVVKNKFYDEPVITCVGFGTERNNWIVPFDHYEMDHVWTYKEKVKILEHVKRRMGRCELIGQFAKFDLKWLLELYGVRFYLDFDTGLAHYHIDENSLHGLKFLSFTFFGAEEYDIDPTTAPWGPISTYLAKDISYCRRLKPIFRKMLHKHTAVERVFDIITMPVQDLYTDAEMNGFFIDREQFDETDKYLIGQIKEAQRRLKKYKRGVNWASPQQVAEMLFEDLGIKPPFDPEKKKKDAKRKREGKKPTVTPSTREGMLLQIDHPIIEDLLFFRGNKQLYNFFIKGWKPFLTSDDLIHASYKIHGAVTGRPSCEQPNLQQVPRDSLIRSLITAPVGWVLVEADLSQIELRIAAELANETTMLHSFYTKEDIHWKTAIREISRQGAYPEKVLDTANHIIGKDVSCDHIYTRNDEGSIVSLGYAEAVRVLTDRGPKIAIMFDLFWKDVRKKAKAINFGFLYGMYQKKFVIYAFEKFGIRVTEAEAKVARDNYFALYPKLLTWHERQKKYAKRHGYVTTLTGRRRRLPDAQGHEQIGKIMEAERQAINSPVQGFAAELNLMAALQFRDEFDWETECRVVGTVHDSILSWVKEEHAERIVPRMLEIMSHPEIMDELDIRIRVPIIAEALLGPWGKGLDLKEWLEAA